MKTPIKLLTRLLIFVACSSSAYAGIFSDLLQSNPRAVPSESTRASAIFQRHLGAPNPVRWARQLPGVANTEVFLSSPAWQATRTEFFQIFGNNAQVNQYLDYQEYLFRRAIRINNKAHFRSLDIKGNLAESLMDDFYLKDGWEKLDGKRGRNGFDGLYVRRNKNGTIIDWIATDAKSGSSKLNMTRRGMQLSQKWIKGNLKDLLSLAEDEYKRAPSAETKQRIADLRQIRKLPGRRPRVFTNRIVNNGGKIQYLLENVDINGNPVGKPMAVNMNASNSGAMLRMERAIYKNLEEYISVHNPKGAAALVKKIQRGFKNGIIKNDSDLYRFIKREIPDKKLAMAVCQDLGAKPPRGSLACETGKGVSKNYGTILSAAAVAGFIIAHDAMQDGITYETFIRAGIASIATFGVGCALDYSMNYLVENYSKYVAEYTLKLSGKEVTKRSVAGLVPKLGSGIGIGLQVAFGLYFIVDTIYNYNQGNITQTNMLVNVSVATITTAGTVFFMCTALSSKLGSVGTAIGGPIGAAIGVGIGLIGGLVTGGYALYVENKRQENLLLEARLRAAWETQNNRIRLQETISKLTNESEQMRNAAWSSLLPTM